MLDGLATLNAANEDEARKLLSSCCGATKWVAELIAARPFSSREALHAAAQRSWRACGKDDLFEAMSHHPRIGEKKDVPARDAAEQAGAALADDQIKAAIADGNRAYEARFGYIYLVCATGKSGRELLDILHTRLKNDPQTELAVAAAEQGKITALRLDKLLDKGNP